MTIVYVVTFHNPTSGKGSYHLAGVFWTENEAQSFIKTAPTSRVPRKYDIRIFQEMGKD